MEMKNRPRTTQSFARQQADLSRSISGRLGSRLAIFWLVLLFVPTPPVYCELARSVKDKAEDQIIVQGQKLRGRIIRLNPTDVEFNTVYGQGTLLITYDSIENIVSQNIYRIIYKDNEIAIGRLLGIQDGKLLVGIDTSSATHVPVAEILTGISEKAYTTSRRTRLQTRLRTRYRYWQGSFDIGYRYETGAVDKDKIELGLNLERRKKPTRFVLDLIYAFEKQRVGENPAITTKDEFIGFLQAEHDIRQRLFVFIRPAYEFDKPRNIVYRWYPGAGIGYKIAENQTKGTFLSVPLGIGYVDENFGNIGTNSYVSWYLGFEGRYEFGQGIIMTAGLLLMPGISNPREDRLLRADFNLTVPIYDPIKLKLRLRDIRDNNPTPEVGNNKFTASLALSIGF